MSTPNSADDVPRHAATPATSLPWSTRRTAARSQLQVAHASSIRSRTQPQVRLPSCTRESSAPSLANGRNASTSREQPLVSGCGDDRRDGIAQGPWRGARRTSCVFANRRLDRHGRLGQMGPAFGMPMAHSCPCIDRACAHGHFRLDICRRASSGFWKLGPDNEGLGPGYRNLQGHFVGTCRRRDERGVFARWANDRVGQPGSHHPVLGSHEWP